MWEVSRGLLRRHAMPPMRQFTNETATTMHALDMDIVLAPLPAVAGAEAATPARKAMPSLPRSKLRTASPNLKVRFHSRAPLGARGTLAGVTQATRRAESVAAHKPMDTSVRVVRGVDSWACAHGCDEPQALVAMVSKSRKLYQNIVGFVRAHYVEKGDPAVCTLRSQLLMALHDSGTAAELCQVRARRLTRAPPTLSKGCIRLGKPMRG